MRRCRHTVLLVTKKQANMQTNNRSHVVAQAGFTFLITNLPWLSTAMLFREALRRSRAACLLSRDAGRAKREALAASLVASQKAPGSYVAAKWGIWFRMSFAYVSYPQLLVMLKHFGYVSLNVFSVLRTIFK